MFLRLTFCLVIKAVILGFLIGWGYIGLAPDEAQYWTWSQALDWGYYSKPPGIAWQIALTTSIFGNTPFGVRCGALLIGSALPLLLYGAALSARLKKETAFWAALAAALSPFGVYLSLAATTDGGAILFLTLALWILVKGMEEERGPNYWLIGGALALGALFKWTAFLFWIPVILSLFRFKRFRRGSLLGGILLSLLAFVPTMYWNASHEWATFRHVGATVAGVSSGNFFDFLGGKSLSSPPFFFFFLF